MINNGILIQSIGLFVQDKRYIWEYIMIGVTNVIRANDTVIWISYALLDVIITYIYFGKILNINYL